MNSIELTQELVKIDSQNPIKNEKEIAGFIKDFLQDLGYNPEIVEFAPNRQSVICSVGENDGLMLNGHIDTVPVVNNWTEDPFGGIIKDGKLFGLGASDMKGGVASMLAAFSNLSKETFKRKLLLAFVADEEVGLRGSNYLLEEKLELLQGITHGVISEPSELKISRGQKGIVALKVIFEGKAAHASRLEQGDNAINKAAAFMNEVVKLNSELSSTKHLLLGPGTINIGKVTGGVKVNIVPDRCEIEIDRRLIPGQTPEEAKKQFENILENLGLSGRIEHFEGHNGRPPLLTPDDSKIIQEIQKVSNAELTVSSGYTEAELYSTKAGIQTVVFGPGQWNVIHKPDEYVLTENLKKAESVFEKLIKNWCL